MREEYIEIGEAATITGLTEKKLMLLALNEQFKLFYPHADRGWEAVPERKVRQVYADQSQRPKAETMTEEELSSQLIWSKYTIWKPGMFHILRTDLDEITSLQSEKVEDDSTPNKEAVDLSLVEILNLITPEIYPEDLTSQGKSAITQRLDKLKNQLPEAFELCCSLVMEAMPCEDREEYLKYTRDDVISRAKEGGVNSPMAKQIYQGLPSSLKKSFADTTTG